MTMMILLPGMAMLHAQLISVQSGMSSDSMMIGDQLRFTLRVEAAENVQFTMPVIRDTLSSHLEVLYPLSADTSRSGGSLVVEHAYAVTGFESGMQLVPAQEVAYSFRGETDTALSMPLMIMVYDPVVDTTQAIMPIKPPINTPVTFREILPWLAVGLGGALVLAAAVFAIWYFRKKKQDPGAFSLRPKEPAHVIAFRELDRLKEKKLWESGQVKAFYTRLTEIIRIYIEQQYGIPAMESTTDEILEAFRGANHDDQLLDDMLGELLELADLVKFAKEDPLPLENQTHLNNAYIFVQKTFPLFYFVKPEEPGKHLEEKEPLETAGLVKMKGGEDGA